MRIGVVNAVLSNTGDAAIYQAIRSTVLGGLSDQRIDFVVFDGNARTTRALYPEWPVCQQLCQLRRFRPLMAFRALQFAWSLWWLGLSYTPRLLKAICALWVCLRLPYARTLKALRSCDVVVSSGGTYLVDSYDFTHRVAEIRVARALGKPVVLWTQSMGPFASARARRAIGHVARSADVVCCRDERSAAAWRSAASAEPRMIVVPDAVFAIELPDPDDTRRIGTRRQLAVSVREWSRTTAGESFEAQSYTSAMRRAVESLIDDGWECTTVSTCQGVPDYPWNDAETAHRIFDGLDISYDDDFHSPDALMRALGRFDLVIATRMHVAIMSLTLGIPVIVIAYEFKTLELFSSLGMAANCIAIEGLSADWLLGSVERFQRNPAEFVLDADSRLALRKRAREPVDVMRKAVLNPSL